MAWLSFWLYDPVSSSPAWFSHVSLRDDDPCSVAVLLAGTTVQCTQDVLHAPVPSHTNQGGSLDLRLKSALGTLSGSVFHLPNPDLSPHVVIPTSSARPSTVREEDGSPVANGSISMDEFLVESCFDEEDLEEEQLDFTFFEVEYEKS
ncbi:hypothetical protein Peur_032138 [Populus x canadensis]